MKVVLVTSSLTFIPENYDEFVHPVLQHPSVVGLIEVQNREFFFLAKGLFLIISLASPAFGFQVLKNWFSGSSARRQRLCEKNDRFILRCVSPNEKSIIEELRKRKIDLVINARTRSFFRKELLSTPRLGCVNIHHGLLPEQRGLMCDFWSHLDESPVGFSIHQMTSKLDDGQIIKVVEVPTDKANYMKSLRNGAQKEAEACRQFLDEVVQKNELPSGLPNFSEHVVYRRNPGLLDFYRLMIKGLRR